MLTLRKSQDRGHADHGWLESYHSFSFAGYHDPAHMGWGNLRVINEDRVAPGMGFGTHGHRDMEIISYVLSGNLAHKDSMGNVKGIPPGDVQRMSAGRGVQHSEFNHAPNETTHFLQIWIEPDQRGIAPGTGFGTHGHRDMEIISYVLSGNIAHKDTLGNVKGIPPGDVQRMSAGTGVQHSEFNHAPNETTHFLQIWIEPNVTGIAPSYEQKTFADSEKRGALRLVASSDGANGSVTIHADAALRAGLFDGDERAVMALDPARKSYVHLIRGELQVNGQALNGGDAALITGETRLELAKGKQAEVLVFDLAA